MEITYELEQQYKRISNTLDDIKAKLYALEHPDENFMDNEAFIKKMNISKRTAQTWREKKLIKYSQIGNQFYYSTEDITNFLKKHHVTNMSHPTKSRR